MRLRSSVLLAAALAVCLALAGCSSGGSDDNGGDGKSLTIWSLEDNADRIKATQAIVDKYSKDKGVQVKLVAVNEDQFPTLIQNAAASGDVPDAIGALSLGNQVRLSTDDVSDSDAATEVIDALGRDTFSPRSLDLVTVDGKTVSVPSDGWTQLLVYRKDLFEKAGLKPPDTYEAMQAAADKLNANGTAGIVVATKPGDTFTQQTYEHFALANGCQLTDDAGKVTLTSKPCVDAMQFFTDLVKKDGVKGGQDVDTTRAAYFAGKAAMVVWSSFILDELAGLRNDALPNCPECKSDPTFLSKNSGIVTAFKGPDGTQPSGYGEISGWAITQDAKNKDGAKDFVQYMMNDAYPDWLALAPEGKFPVRAGTKDDPEKFTKAWDGLKAGVDKKEPLSSVYPPETLDIIRNSAKTLNRWGFPQGQGALAGAMLGELPVPKAVATVLDGQADATQASATAQKDVEELAQSIK
jgi:multiple sugar transport system substrate-binding protein